MHKLIDKDVNHITLNFLDGSVMSFKCVVQTINRESRVFLTEPWIDSPDLKSNYLKEDESHYVTKMVGETPHFRIVNRVIDATIFYADDTTSNHDVTIFHSKDKDGNVTECYICVSEM